MLRAMAGDSSLMSKLSEHVLRQVSHEDWTKDKGRDNSCCAVEECLSQLAEFEQLVGQLTQVEGSPLQKHRAGADEWKEKGNEAFKIGAWQKAVESYTKALQYAPHNGASNKALLAPLFSNRAAALEKLGETGAVLIDCTYATEADPQFSKAWYRRGKARAVLKDLVGAISDLETALEIESGGASSRSAVLEVQRGASESSDKVSESGKRAKKNGPVSGSAKQIAEELKGVRALLPQGGLQTEAEDTETSAGASQRGLEGRKGNAASVDVSLGSDASLCAVEVFHQHGKGRGLKSTRVFDPGDVAIFEAPFAAVLLKGRRASHCYHCFAALPANPLPCSGCAGPLFCAHVCRGVALGKRSAEPSLIDQNRGPNGLAGGAEALEERLRNGSHAAEGSNRGTGATDCAQRAVGGHAYECGGASWAAILPPDAVLAVRVLARSRSSEEIDKRAPDGKRHFEVASLCHHLDRLPADERAPLLVLACTAARCAVAAGILTTSTEVLSTIGRLRANVMAVNDVTFCGARETLVSTWHSPFALKEGQSSGRMGLLEAGAQLVGTNENSKRNQSRRTPSEAENGGKAGFKNKVQGNGRANFRDLGAASRLTFEQTQLGQALYPTATLLNHSCDPNAAVSFTGNLVTLRAVKRVRAGEELTLSYGPQKGETRSAERRKWLWERYAFVCNCATCVGDQTSDVLMTGLRCPHTSCEGVVPQYSAAGAFCFPLPRSTTEERMSGKTPPLECRDPPASHANECGNDPYVTEQTGAQLGHRGGVEKGGAGVCSDCDLDPPDVVCAECGGRLLCLECDSHVHQPRSKRRGAHVRARVGEDSMWTEQQTAHQSGNSIERISPERESTKGAEEELRSKVRKVVTTEKIEGGRPLVGSAGFAENNGQGTEHVDRECKFAENGASNIESRVSALSLTSGLRESAHSASIEQSTRLVRPILNQESTGVSSDTSTGSKVERGRCTVCGTSVDVADALAKIEAGWAAACGRMPYLEAAEMALATARGVLHPRNRKLAEYEDHLAETCAQAGRVNEARRHCAQSLQILEYHYPVGSLPLAHEYTKLSSLAAAAGTGHEAGDLHAKAEAIWRAHYGHTYVSRDRRVDDLKESSAELVSTFSGDQSRVWF